MSVITQKAIQDLEDSLIKMWFRNPTTPSIEKGTREEIRPILEQRLNLLTYDLCADLSAHDDDDEIKGEPI